VSGGLDAGSFMSRAGGGAGAWVRASVWAWAWARARAQAWAWAGGVRAGDGEADSVVADVNWRWLLFAYGGTMIILFAYLRPMIAPD
jgi:hypothetical protein